MPGIPSAKADAITSKVATLEAEAQQLGGPVTALTVQALDKEGVLADPAHRSAIKARATAAAAKAELSPSAAAPHHIATQTAPISAGSTIRHAATQTVAKG